MSNCMEKTVYRWASWSSVFYTQINAADDVSVDDVPDEVFENEEVPDSEFENDDDFDDVADDDDYLIIYNHNFFLNVDLFSVNSQLVIRIDSSLMCLVKQSGLSLTQVNKATVSVALFSTKIVCLIESLAEYRKGKPHYHFSVVTTGGGDEADATLCIIIAFATFIALCDPKGYKNMETGDRLTVHSKDLQS
ncbi:hypothetical protein LXL04_014863 [Taraxacum kok-saghyz]